MSFCEVFLEIKQGYVLRAERDELHREACEMGLAKILSNQGDFYDPKTNRYPLEINVRSHSIRIRFAEWCGSPLFSFGTKAYEFLHHDWRFYAERVRLRGEKLKEKSLDDEIRDFYKENGGAGL